MMKHKRSNITILAFEGPDKSGKSTLIREINKAVNYRFLCIDRFIGSAWVYDKLTERRDRTDSLVKAETELANLTNITMLNIFLKCDIVELRQRIEREDEHKETRLQHLEAVVVLYEEYLRKIARLPIIEVDTTNKTLEGTVQEIITRVETYEQNNS